MVRVTRRAVLELSAAACVAACMPRGARGQSPPRHTASTPMQTRAIPKSGEQIPVIGLGTWQTFDVGTGAAERADVVEVLRRFLEAGGRVIDSSPMYGRSEAVTGDALAELSAIGKPFLATKVWTQGKRDGIEQMERSLRRMRTERIDLMQVHNLLDWKVHLPVLREWKRAGKARYVGVTHYTHGAFAELEAILRKETLDFIQLPYSLADREAEKRLLPAAKDTGTAVLVMQPFQEGRLFGLVKGKPLPEWAKEFDAASWAQFFLKFVLGHAAVTCPIPATSNPKHLSDNVKAGQGRLPDEKTRRLMVEALGL